MNADVAIFASVLSATMNKGKTMTQAFNKIDVSDFVAELRRGRNSEFTLTERKLDGPSGLHLYMDSTHDDLTRPWPRPAYVNTSLRIVSQRNIADPYPDDHLDVDLTFFQSADGSRLQVRATVFVNGRSVITRYGWGNTWKVAIAYLLSNANYSGDLDDALGFLFADRITRAYYRTYNDQNHLGPMYLVTADGQCTLVNLLSDQPTYWLYSPVIRRHLHSNTVIRPGYVLKGQLDQTLVKTADDAVQWLDDVRSVRRMSNRLDSDL